jgi:RecB family exonuclease
LHNLTYAYKWRELDIEKEVQLDDGDKVTLHGRLDMYDYKKGDIIDLKSTSAVKWQQEKGLIPRGNDIDQLQCYGTLFLDLVKVSELTSLYADMKNLIAFRIPFIDREFWIKARLARLHSALETLNTPVAEPSKLCDICAYQDRCHKE